jgi:hypothetical protein
VPTEHEDELRRNALSAFIDECVAEGFRIETRSDTHAIIASPPRLSDLLGRVLKRDRNQRHVVSVDEHGIITTRPAEPIRW